MGRWRWAVEGASSCSWRRWSRPNDGETLIWEDGKIEGAEQRVGTLPDDRLGLTPDGPFYYAREAAAEPWAFVAYVLQGEDRPRSVDCEDMPEREEGQGVERASAGRRIPSND